MGIVSKFVVFWTVSRIQDEKCAAKFHYIKTFCGRVVAQSIAFWVVSIFFWFQWSSVCRYRSMTDARRYALWPDPRSWSRSRVLETWKPLNSSRQSVLHGTNFYFVCFLVVWPTRWDLALNWHSFTERLNITVVMFGCVPTFLVHYVLVIMSTLMQFLYTIWSFSMLYW